MSYRFAGAGRPAVPRSMGGLLKVILIVTIALGFALRSHDLEGQSMWSDEGLSAYRSALPVPEILASTITLDGVETRDTTPPFHLLLLHAVRAAAGDSVFSMRYAGVAVSSLAIALTYAIGALCLGRKTGLFAAFLMAISPFHVWQSQVLRNYGLLLTLNLLSVYGLYRFLLVRSGRRRASWLLLWLAASLLGIYTHFFALFVFAYGGLALLLTAIRGKGIGRFMSRAWFWAAAGAVLLVVIPAMALAINRFAAGQQFDFFFIPLSTFLTHIASALGVGVHWTLSFEWWYFLPAVLVALIGLIFAWRRRPFAAALLLGYQIIPLGLLYGLSYINPLYNGVRHLLIGLPPFVILLASGIVGPLESGASAAQGRALRRPWRLIGPTLLLVVIAIQLYWLNQQFTAPELVRDDVRGVAQYLNDTAGPEDVIILHDTIIRPTFEYYYEGSAPVISVPRFDEANVDSGIQALQEAAQGADRVWFLTQPTPRTGFDVEVLPQWAREHWPRFLNDPYPAIWLRVRLEGFRPEALIEHVPEEATPVDVSWQDTLRLLGYEIPEVFTASEEAWLTLYLSQPDSTPEQHTLSLRLVDGDGLAWAQMDEIIKGGYPPESRAADTLMRYDHRLQVPPGVPPGQYALQARLVRTADGFTVPLANGEVEYHLADVAVEAASCAAAGDIEADVHLKRSFGSAIQLVAHSRPPEAAQAGRPLSVQVWWCARRPPQADYQLRLQLLDGEEKVVAERFGPLVREAYPPSQWQQAALLLGQPSLTIPGDVEAGLFEVRLSVMQPGGEEAIRVGWPLGGRSVSLGQVAVSALPIETELPTVSHPFLAELFQPVAVEFRGYDLVTDGAPADQLAPGDDVELTLVWRPVSGDLSSSYKVFAHLTDESGQIVSQSDTVPANGFRPTTGWRAGEVIIDEHKLSIPEGLGAGEYTLWVGLYDPETSQRPPIFVDGQEQPDGRLQIARLAIRP